MTTSPSKPSDDSTTQSTSLLPAKSSGAKMSLPMTLLGDIHTSDLTEPCLRKVLLRHQQKAEPVAPTALFRGILIGKWLEHIHEKDEIPTDISATIWDDLVKELEAEGRQPSESVETNRATIEGDVLLICQRYMARMMPLFRQCEYIGTELPCRTEIDGIKFASHVDLLLRDTGNVLGYGKGRLLVIDWKYRAEVPTKAYLSRNYQFAMYWLAMLEGSVMTYPAFNVWEEYGESAQLLWCHLPYLFPFKRKTTLKDDNGDPVVYLKGDERPVTSILRDVNFKREALQGIRRDIVERVQVMRAGYFPKAPEPVRCTVCDSRDFCTRGDTPELLENKE